MNVFFDPEFDQGAWPGSLAGRTAAWGEVWLGQTGLLNLLETRLGLAREFEPDAARAAALVPRLRSLDGFWADSAGHDPFGVARKMIEWRDRLYLHGWSGQPVSPRLAQLAELTSEVLPGYPDRLAEVAQALNRRTSGIERLVCYEPEEDLPRVWKEVLSVLKQTGTTVEFVTVSPTLATGDLAGARDYGFRPVGDGSLLLLRSPGPAEAAHQAAAWLASGEPTETLIIRPDPILDAALKRFGLPSAGSTRPSSENSLLQILPLVLELGRQPPDPQRALELLTLPTGPVPAKLGWQLARILTDTPAVNSEAWREKVEEFLDSVDEADRHKELAARLTGIFDSPHSGEDYQASEIIGRTRLVTRWLQARLGRAPEKDRPAWTSALVQAENLVRLLDLSGMTALRDAQLARLLEAATSEVRELVDYEAEAGLAAIGSPGAMAGPVRRVLWWNFNQAAAPVVTRPPFSPAEVASLAEAGVSLPEPAAEATTQASRWVRPLLLAGVEMLLVCPQFDERGQPCFPHPLWDEIEGRLDQDSNTAPLVMDEIPATSCLSRRQRALQQLPDCPDRVSVNPAKLSTALAKRQEESATSLSRLVGCPFAWVVRYLGQVWPGFSAALGNRWQIEGTLLHELLARILVEQPASPQRAGEIAAEFLDRFGPFLAGGVFRPEAAAERTRVRMKLRRAAVALTRQLLAGRHRVSAVEMERQTPVAELGLTVKGRLDAVIDNGAAVIDLKRGSLKTYEDQLNQGTAFQLAVYGHLLRDGPTAPFPVAAYFIMRDQVMLTTEPTAFPEARYVDGPGLAETWAGLIEAVQKRRTELRAGQIASPGNSGELPRSGWEEDQLVLEPACRFCDLAYACGHDLEKG